MNNSIPIIDICDFNKWIMKTIHLSLWIISIALLVACSSSDEEQMPIGVGSIPNTATLHIDGRIQYFDAKTRATTSEWKDSAKLYIKFQTANGKVDGIATYYQDADEWEVNYYGNLTRGDTTSCEVYYFENSVEQTETSVSLYQHSVCYADTLATYYYQNGMVTLKTTLKPLTGRIRFKGEVGYTFVLSGLKWYSGYDIKKNILSTQSNPLTLTVENDGYTPYVYGAFADTEKRELAVVLDSVYNFIRSFDQCVLAIGESGYINVPTKNSRNGWNMGLGLCPDTNHPHVIDLGLDVKFACCNVGASSPIDYGGYFAWGEISTKNDFSWKSYKWCEDTENTIITKYCTDSSYGIVDNMVLLELCDDVARVNMGEGWRMPTINELSELDTKCTWTWTSIFGVNGYIVTAANGNSIFMPAAGYYSENGEWNVGSSGYYYSSSLNTSDNNKCARHLGFSSSGHGTGSIGLRRNCGASVRPVIGSFFSVFPSSLTFSYVASSDTLQIVTDQKSITVNTTTEASLWITPSISQDKKKVIITVTENTNTESRTGTVIIIAGTRVFLVEVKQGVNSSYKICPDTNHPHSIDLGLSVKFACVNVGADTPIDYGDHFAWGETTTKSVYEWSNYKWCEWYGGYSITKYCTNMSDGDVDAMVQLELNDDVAHAKWGRAWRVPTYEELKELKEMCTWKRTTLNTVSGYQVKSSNGNSIFLPESGYDGQYFGSCGAYWSSSLYVPENILAHSLTFDLYDDGPSLERNGRCLGFCIRPVTE